MTALLEPTREDLDQWARAVAMYHDESAYNGWSGLIDADKKIFHEIVQLAQMPQPSSWGPDSYITVTDLFCGAGGSTSGAESVAGVRVRMASNHWRLALDTHNHNHQHVDHDIEGIERIDPRRFPPTDILWASPSCTFWSIARGEKETFRTDTETNPGLFDLADYDDADDEPESKEAAERSRALMHDVPRFAAHHRYKAIIVENVPRLLKWWYFPKWIARFRAMGYKHKVLTLNSAFAHQLGGPAPQLRDRVYVVFWLEKYQEPDFDRWTRPQAWCPRCDKPVTAMQSPNDPRNPYGSYAQQYWYRCPSTSCAHAKVHPYVLPAAAAIDWTRPGVRLGDKPPQKKYGGLPLAPKTMARIEAGLRRYARPFVAEVAGNTFERRPGVRTWPIEQPLKTLHTTMSKGLLIPMEGRDGKDARPVARPHRAQTGRLETALLVPAGGTWNDTARLVDEPMRTRTAVEAEGLCVIPLRNNNRPKHIAEPLDTFAAAGQHHGLAMIMRNNTARGDAGQMSTPVDEPMRTLTTAGHQSLVWNPNVLYAYDTGMFRSIDKQPLPTQTTIEGDALIETGVEVMDSLFRMLFDTEIKSGMGFAESFAMPFGSVRDRVRMCGNAVTPPVARDLIAAVVEAITGDEIRPAA
jgi:DNA (cytosine-5)-methyltransferase 1